MLEVQWNNRKQKQFSKSKRQNSVRAKRAERQKSKRAKGQKGKKGKRGKKGKNNGNIDEFLQTKHDKIQSKSVACYKTPSKKLMSVKMEK